ncbi:MAG TPA: large-conductance mechanosensitive channel protein MscL [Flavobacteriales bacterium]|nr:large-conductance mechanosensitive channel protein MscL [Flavobacteriales bacterium]
MKILNEFREFALKGNMFDMAVGIIIGAAFNKIVSSLVEDMFMPPLGYVIGRVDFKDLAYELQPRLTDDSGAILQEAVNLRYGAFMQTSIDFVIIALTVFVVIKVINKLKRKAEDETDKTVETPKNIQLLAEIRDLLKKEGKA